MAINSLINPLHSHRIKNQEQRIGKDFLDHVMGCKYAYGNFIKNRKATIVQFELYIKILKKNITNLNDDIKSLKQLKDNIPKFRQIWKF